LRWGSSDSQCTDGYTLWTLEGADTPWMLATLPFVGYAIFRYQYLSEQKSGERPEELLTKDTGMLFSILFWAISSLVILFYGVK
jgi:4-hydroxybenzoate polyprenyltransferase